MLKDISILLKILDCEITFSLEDGIMLIHLQKPTEDGVKILDFTVTEDYLNHTANDWLIGTLIEKWGNPEEYYIKGQN